MDDTTSRSVVERARAVIPGGAQTGLRAQAYDLGEVAFSESSGPTLETVDGEEFTDYHLAFGPIVLGHGHPAVDDAAKATIDDGVLYGAATTALEVEVAERVVDLLPSAEMVNFCNSGTEATYHAIRLARAYTGNDRVLKFEGCYHGWHDYVDISVYPPRERVGETHPESDGMLPEAVDHTEVLPFNDAEAVVEAFAEFDDIGAVICEPIPHSVDCLVPDEGFLETLRETTAENDVPLIFDEVITGFRHSARGMQHELGVTPDLTALAKAMGNGYPVAAVCGREDLMAQAGGDNTSGVVISGTYSGHPVGLAAASETLRVLSAEPVIEEITALGERYREGLDGLFSEHGIEGRVVGYGSVFSPQFGVTGEPQRYEDVLGLDEERFVAFARGMRERGHFFTPNPYKRQHLSWAHGEAELETYLAAADAVLGSLPVN
ncbi:aspartate aminotransferase family protein [Halalkalicoccus jeotgali]|uniref:Glutamate-1-semialdehyde 2,1-aminomutase n=1 Tax=Halalkalicoccus jeotgali (strain DSM 18796 / CECT 7217 / JCM 14584 / KCTC 4019 / B3) TaxID=795797 RepID=D8J330_HALJB|nr:aspartate aminotransferase family protein [Halalkalicoccus jeotgali]ADJ15137.1 aminotransferase class-III [Halalkalicoccus jeotgali B3]ELY35143.1 class III aminotransferase [Halalkalicoccus jeotgali B3]